MSRLATIIDEKNAEARRYALEQLARFNSIRSVRYENRSGKDKEFMSAMVKDPWNLAGLLTLEEILHVYQTGHMDLVENLYFYTKKFVDDGMSYPVEFSIELKHLSEEIDRALTNIQKTILSTVKGNSYWFGDIAG